MKTLLVTGGAGFIGSCFIRTSIEKYNIVNIDALTYAGNLENLKSVETYPQYRFVKGNICNRDLLDRIFSEHDIDAVINFAAESHVDRSIEEPEVFLQTNVLGTQILLDIAKKRWSVRPDDKYCREYKPGVKFIQVSTDEVYGTLGATGLFKESTPLAPNSPYSASKASSDLLTLAYYHTFGFPVNITRCSNNYGPYQFPEKFIPLIIYNCLCDKAIPIYGDGLQVRDWLHVEDHCNALEAVLERGRPGEIYNIGGNCERTNIEIARTVLRHMRKPESVISYVKDRPGHDRRYAINDKKIKTELEWESKHCLESGIEKTVLWYINNRGWMERITGGEYAKYYERYYNF